MAPHGATHSQAAVSENGSTSYHNQPSRVVDWIEWQHNSGIGYIYRSAVESNGAHGGEVSRQSLSNSDCDFFSAKSVARVR